MRIVRSDDGGPSGEGVSSVEVFGFVGWITSSVAYGEGIRGTLKRAGNAAGSLVGVGPLPPPLCRRQAHQAPAPPPPSCPCAVLYILWAYIPNSVLESYGIHYYPSKYWAVALPTWVCVTVVAVYWAYEGCAAAWRRSAIPSTLTAGYYCSRYSFAAAAGMSLAPMSSSRYSPSPSQASSSRLPSLRSLCMTSALAPGDPSNLRDWATRRKEDAGMPSYFSPAVHAVPPLVDIPQQIVSDVLFGGLTPQGGKWGDGRRAPWEHAVVEGSSGCWLVSAYLSSHNVFHFSCCLFTTGPPFPRCPVLLAEAEQRYDSGRQRRQRTAESDVT